MKNICLKLCQSLLYHKQKSRSLFLSLFVTINVIFPYCNSLSAEELVVPLQTIEKSTNFYLPHFHLQSSTLAANYLELLETILRFDFSESGLINLVEEKAEDLKHLQKYEDMYWKERHITHVFQAKVKGQTVFFHLRNLHDPAKNKEFPVHLSGVLCDDRKKIHHLSDQICEITTGFRGIASTQILYSVQHPKENLKELDWKSEIWICDYDGANPRKIPSGHGYAITPVFFPPFHGTHLSKFVFVSYRNGQPKIYTSNLDGSEQKPLLSLRGNQLLPTIAANCQLFGFISDASGRADLFIQYYHPEKGTLGKPMQIYSFPKSVQASPSFRPDGKQIAFVSDKEGTPKIYLLSVPKYREKNYKPKPFCITYHYRENTCPSWSYDGKKIVYSAKIEGIRQIVLYDLPSGKEVQLTFDKVHKENPSWAPDNIHVVYNTVDRSSSELYTLNIHKPNPIRITTGVGRKHYPCWGPN